MNRDQFGGSVVAAAVFGGQSAAVHLSQRGATATGIEPRPNSPPSHDGGLVG